MKLFYLCVLAFTSFIATAARHPKRVVLEKTCEGHGVDKSLDSSERNSGRASRRGDDRGEEVSGSAPSRDEYYPRDEYFGSSDGDGFYK